jgi:hypothetical protein
MSLLAISSNQKQVSGAGVVGQVAHGAYPLTRPGLEAPVSPHESSLMLICPSTAGRPDASVSRWSRSALAAGSSAGPGAGVGLEDDLARRGGEEELGGAGQAGSVVLAALALMLVLCEGVANDWSVLHLRDVLDAPAATAALAYGAFSSAMTAGRLLADRVAARFGSVAIVRYGACMAALGLAAAAELPGRTQERETA